MVNTLPDWVTVVGTRSVTVLPAPVIVVATKSVTVFADGVKVTVVVIAGWV